MRKTWVKAGFRVPLGSPYHVSLIDSTNKKHIVVAHQVNAISEGLATVDQSGIKNLFSSSVHDKWESVTARPTGPVDLLVDLDYMRLHPIELERQENLGIVQSLFPVGLIYLRQILESLKRELGNVKK